MAEQRMNSSPVSSMKGLAASLSSHFHRYDRHGDAAYDGFQRDLKLLRRENVDLRFELLTSVNPRDPKSLLAGELPGMKANQPVQLSHGSGNEEGKHRRITGRIPQRSRRKATLLMPGKSRPKAVGDRQ